MGSRRKAIRRWKFLQQEEHVPISPCQSTVHTNSVAKPGIPGAIKIGWVCTADYRMLLGTAVQPVLAWKNGTLNWRWWWWWRSLWNNSSSSSTFSALRRLHQETWRSINRSHRTSRGDRSAWRDRSIASNGKHCFHPQLGLDMRPLHISWTLPIQGANQAHPYQLFHILSKFSCPYPHTSPPPPPQFYSRHPISVSPFLSR